MENLEIRLVKDKAELQHTFRIREAVFVKEQKVPYQLEIDEFDKISKAKHVIMRYRGKPIGCARIRLMGEKAKLERIAILKESRDRGFGKALIEYMIAFCKKKGSKEIILHGQLRSKKFYEKAGFKSRGKIFMDAGIEHIEMFLRLHN